MIARFLAEEDLAAVAIVHRAAFPRAAVSHLGLGAVRRYYESLTDGPHEAVGLGAFAGDRLLGFSFVGWRHVAEVRFVRQHALYLLGCLMLRPKLFFQPFIRSRIRSGLELLGQSIWSQGEPEPTDRQGERSYGIQYLAVDPEFQGRGVGRFLLGASEDWAGARGCAEIQLSVYLDNAPAIRLYEQMGWRKLAPEGVWRGLMGKRLAQFPEATKRRKLIASGRASPGQGLAARRQLDANDRAGATL